MSELGPDEYGFFSTHNALENGGDADFNEIIVLRLSKLGAEKGMTLKVSVYPFYDVEMVKRIIIEKFDLPHSTAISEIRVFQRGTELPNYRSLSYFANTISKIHFTWSFRETTKSIGIRAFDLKHSGSLEKLMTEVNLGFQRGLAPRLTVDGTGGTYILCNSVGKRVALFKPRDEEAFTPNNPRSYEGQFGQKGFRSGVFSGEGAIREVAAYLFDAHYGGHADVPQTTKAEARHPAFCHRVHIKQKDSSVKEFDFENTKTFWKEGSFQEFVDAPETCGDYDARVFSVSDVHYIGMLDIALLNLDRNDGNILVAQQPVCSKNIKLTPDGKPSKFRLIPIDHGLILPDTMDVGIFDLVWFYWPQSYIPFSEAELYYIFSLDGDRDAQRLARKLEIRKHCLRTMRVTTRVLQLGAKMHLNLNQIASFIVRTEGFQHPSIVEKSVRTALAQAYTLVSVNSLVNQGRLGDISLVMDLHLTDKTKRRSNPQSQASYSLESLKTQYSELLTKDASPVISRQTVEVDGEDANIFNCNGRGPEGTDSIKNLSSLSSSSTSFFSSSSFSESSSEDNIKEERTGSLFKLKGQRRTQKKVHMQLVSDNAVAPLDKTLSHKGTNVLGKTAETMTVGFKRKGTSSVAVEDDENPSRIGTRRRPTSFHRRGTLSSCSLQPSCTWLLFDSHNRPVSVNWNDVLFEKSFFECFKLIMKKHIIEAHPNWKSYPFNGHELLNKHKLDTL